jgi:hypothetical protein
MQTGDVIKSSEIAECVVGDLGCDGQGSGNKIGG